MRAVWHRLHPHPHASSSKHPQHHHQHVLLACRHQHYQIQDKVVVDVYAKNTPKERVSVSFQPRHLHVVIKDAEGQVGLLLVMPACV